jgi:hypothetical protein
MIGRVVDLAADGVVDRVFDHLFIDAIASPRRAMPSSTSGIGALV